MSENLIAIGIAALIGAGIMLIQSHLGVTVCHDWDMGC